MITRRRNTSHRWTPHPSRTQLSSDTCFWGYTAEDRREASSHSPFTLTYHPNRLGNPFSKDPQQRGSSKWPPTEGLIELSCLTAVSLLNRNGDIKMIKLNHQNTINTRSLQYRANHLPLCLEAITILCIIQQYMFTDVPKLARND